jgi:hypothetical protein
MTVSLAGYVSAILSSWRIERRALRALTARPISKLIEAGRIGFSRYLPPPPPPALMPLLQSVHRP